MARKPKDISLEADGMENEVESLELDSDDNETAMDLDEEDEDDKPAKGKPRRKKKEPAGFAAQMLKNASADEKPAAKAKGKAETAEESVTEEVKAGADPSTTPVAEGTDISDDAPEKKARRPRSTTEEKNLSVAMVSAFEAMTAHWTTAKEATDALVINFEKVKKDLEEIKQASAEPLQKLIDQTKEKQAVASRVMFALSLGAIIFSFVSLTLSQSVRGQLLAVQKPVTFTTKSAPLSAPLSAPVEKTWAAKTVPVVPPQPRVAAPATNEVAALDTKAVSRAVRKPRSTKK